VIAVNIMNCPMPVGIEDFGKLVNEKYYMIDKTRFIKELIDCRGEVTLITRPRRFGKTLTLSMLRYFFSVENAAENRKLFAGLDIERAGDRYWQEQGTRPVLFLSLKEVHGKSFGLALDILARHMQGLCLIHRYLLDSDRVLPESKQAMQLLLDLKGGEADLRSSLCSLLKWLKMHYGRSPILLLDEYDAPVISAWENGYYDECIDFVRGFVGEALKTNDALDFAVLTGVTRISKESIFSGLNNLSVSSVLSKRYSDIFGFTPEEAERLMTDCGAEDKLPELKKWYDGYKFGDTEIYNPWSVIRFVAEGCTFQPYWINVSANSILKDMLARVDNRRRQELAGLLEGRPVETPVMENLVFANLRTNRNALYMMLLTAGYLKAVEVWHDERHRIWARLQIPNLEIGLAYETEILDYIVPSQGEILLRDMLDAMTAGDADGFTEHLGEILRDYVSYHDPTAQPENFYHGLLLGVAVLLQGTYQVESNKESGFGRFDLAFFPKKNDKPGVVLEIKTAGAGEEKEAMAKEALAQIEAKDYMANFAKQGIRDVWKYGIAFSGKTVWIERG